LFTQLWAAGVIELVGGLMIAFGVFASIAAFIASGEMAVAYFQVHAPRGTFWRVATADWRLTIGDWIAE
jgi:putative oxidoreductase